LPARPGVGRIIHETRGAATVIPVFVNGLGNDLVRQVAGNFLSSSAGGTPVTVVFGEPVAFGELLEGAPSPELDQRIAERALEAVRALGAEERVLRADVHASRASRRR
jgi:1-acyl-sn-glycerol-3-phosphate acyltransferase